MSVFTSDKLLTRERRSQLRAYWREQGVSPATIAERLSGIAFLLPHGADPQVVGAEGALAMVPEAVLRLKSERTIAGYRRAWRAYSQWAASQGARTVAASEVDRCRQVRARFATWLVDRGVSRSYSRQLASALGVFDGMNLAGPAAHLERVFVEAPPTSQQGIEAVWGRFSTFHLEAEGTAITGLFDLDMDATVTAVLSLWAARGADPQALLLAKEVAAPRGVSEVWRMQDDHGREAVYQLVLRAGTSPWLLPLRPSGLLRPSLTAVREALLRVEQQGFPGGQQWGIKPPEASPERIQRTAAALSDIPLPPV